MLLKNELQTGSERKCKRINEVKGDLNNVGNGNRYLDVLLFVTVGHFCVHSCLCHLLVDFG
jgi:hypothetical protein